LIISKKSAAPSFVVLTAATIEMYTLLLFKEMSFYKQKFKDPALLSFL